MIKSLLAFIIIMALAEGCTTAYDVKEGSTPQPSINLAISAGDDLSTRSIGFNSGAFGTVKTVAEGGETLAFGNNTGHHGNVDVRASERQINGSSEESVTTITARIERKKKPRNTFSATAIAGNGIAWFSIQGPN